MSDMALYIELHTCKKKNLSENRYSLLDGCDSDKGTLVSFVHSADVLIWHILHLNRLPEHDCA